MSLRSTVGRHQPFPADMANGCFSHFSDEPFDAAYVCNRAKSSRSGELYGF